MRGLLVGFGGRCEGGVRQSADLRQEIKFQELGMEFNHCVAYRISKGGSAGLCLHTLPIGGRQGLDIDGVGLRRIQMQQDADLLSPVSVRLMTATLK